MNLFNRKLTRPSKLDWFGPVYSYSGYAQHNRGILLGLDKLGYDCYLLPSERDIPEGLRDKSRLIALSLKKDPNPRPGICINLIPPPALPAWGKYSILYTTMESKTVHPGFLARCNQFDEVWVPCLDNYKSLKPVLDKKIPLKIVPEGVDICAWNPWIRKTDKEKSDKFTFMFSGDWSYRKGCDLMIRAFAAAFKPADNVRLLLHSHYQGNGADTSLHRIVLEINQMLSENNIKDTPEIKLLCNHYSDAELPTIYKLADVGLFPTRGEAWLLPAIQMMSMGIPVITTAWGGQTDFAKNYNSYYIKVKDYRRLDQYCTCDVDFYKDQLFPEPDFDSLVYQMKRAFNDRELLKNKGRSAALEIGTKFDWKQAVEIADKRLKEINQMFGGTL